MAELFCFFERPPSVWFLETVQSSTLDLSEFNVNVMTGNNEAYQRSPYDPVIQKWPFFFVQTPEFFFTSMKLSFASYIMSSIEVKKILGSGQKERSFPNHWVIGRMLVCFIVSGHDSNIEF